MRARKANPARVDRPWWVEFALWGLPNRASALACLGMLLWIGALAVFLGFGDIRDSLGVLAQYLTLSQLQASLWGLGVLASLFALWYLRAILWVDRHGGWPRKASPPAEAASAGAPAELPPAEAASEDVPAELPQAAAASADGQADSSPTEAASAGLPAESPPTEADVEGESPAAVAASADVPAETPGHEQPRDIVA